jgi:ubiquinone/menaquinone biosynthesis C-methylase UbiE
MRTDDPYRRIAPLYDRLIEPMQAGVRRIALETVTPQPSWSVLDVGCGTGTALAQYLEAGCDVSGADVSPAMIAEAKARLGDQAELIVTDGEALPFAAERFDLVTASMVLHEVHEADRAGFVAEMARVTKKTGRMMFVDFRFGTLRGLKGRGLRAMSVVVERFSGHYSHFRSFEAKGGVPGVLAPERLNIEREKIVGGGNMAIWLVNRGNP